VAAARDQRVHELVAVRVGAIDVVARTVQGVEQAQRARRRVEADGHPHACVLRREARQQDRDLLVGVRRRAQPCVTQRQPGHARAALRVGDVARDRRADDRAALAALLERHDAAEQAPVELGDRDLRRGVERRQPAGGLLPRGARGRRADGLDDRHVERLQRGRVPALLGIGGVRAAGGEHRDEQRVDVAVDERERRHVAVAVAAQRRRPDGERVRARGLDLRRQLVDPCGVARDPVRAVEADADRRARGVVRRERVGQRDVAEARDVDAEVGHLVRRLEAVALEQERVSEESQQLLDVGDVAVAQILAGLRDRARRRRRQRGHLRVGLDLAAEREQRDAAFQTACAQQVEALRPAAAAAEHAAQHDGGAGRRRGSRRRTSPGRSRRRGSRSARPGSRRRGAARRRRSRGSRCQLS